MTTYLITLVIQDKCVQRRVSATKPAFAICGLLRKINRPMATVSALSCKAVA